MDGHGPAETSAAAVWVAAPAPWRALVTDVCVRFAIRPNYRETLADIRRELVAGSRDLVFLHVGSDEWLRLPAGLMPLYDTSPATGVVLLGQIAAANRLRLQRLGLVWTVARPWNRNELARLIRLWLHANAPQQNSPEPLRDP